MEAAAAAAGWYADPARVFWARYWDGHDWTAWVSDGGPLFRDPKAPTDEASHLEYLEAFIDDAAARRVIGPGARDALLSLARAREAGAATGPAPARPTSAAPATVTPMPRPEPRAAVARKAVRPHPTPSPARAPAAAPARAPAPVTPIRPVEPLREPARRTWNRITSAVAGDLAVHGLAYLGVLLLFAGIFGLVVFAFGDVAPAWRPVAELATPIGLFGAAWFLRGRGAPFVADALVALAGAVVPVVFVASAMDGSDVPPDLTGFALAVWLTLGCLAIAATYWFVAARRPESMLRYLIAPTVWVAAAMAGLVTVDPIPSGRDVATPHAAQMAIVSVAIVLTAACRRFVPDRVARMIETECAVGYAAIYTLVLATAAVEGWPTAPLVLAAAAGILLAEILARRFDAAVIAVAQAVLVAAAIAPFQPVFGTATAAAGVTIAELGLLEWTGHRRPSDIGCATTLVAAGIALGFTIVEPWPALAAGSAAWTWVLFRRAEAAPWLAMVKDELWLVLAVLVPVLPATSVLRLTDLDAALLILAGAVAAIAVLARVGADRSDPLWQWWPRGALVVLGLGTAIAVPATSNAAPNATLVVATLVVAVGLLVAPGPFAANFWTTAPAVVWAGLLAAAYEGVPVVTTATGVAVVALACIAASNTGRAGPHLGALGYALAFGALVAVPRGGWSAVAVEAMFTAGWLLTLVRQERGRCRVLDALTSSPSFAELEPGPQYAPAILTEAGVVLTGFGVLVAAGVQETWWPPAVALGGAALCATGLVFASRHRMASVFAIGGLGLTVVAIAMLQGGDGRVALTLSAAFAASLVAPKALRSVGLLWWSWMLFAVWTVSIARFLWLPSGLEFSLLLSWGAVVSMVVLYVDEWRNGRRSTGQVVREARFIPPVVLAPVAIVLGLGGSFSHAPHVFGAWSFVVALVALVIALQLHAGLLTTITYALFGVALGAWLPFNAVENPWTLVLFAALLVLWGAALAHLTPERSLIGRWDTAPGFVAYATLAVALVASLAVGYIPATFLGAAAVLTLVSFVERDPSYFVIGDGLALVGMFVLGYGWLTLALVANTVLAALVAERVRDELRLPVQIASAANGTGAWIAFLSWLALSARDAMFWTTVVGGAGVFAIASAFRWLRLAKDWAAVWLAPMFVGSAAGLFVAQATESESMRDSAFIATAVALLFIAGASAAAASPLQIRSLRLATPALVTGAAVCLMAGVHPTIGQVVWLAMVAGVVCTLAALVTLAMRPESLWIWPWLAAGAVATCLSIGAAAVGLSENALEPYWTTAALVAASVETAAVGTATRRSEILLAAAPLACAAWLVYAHDAFTDPMWFGIPVGVTILVDTGLIRWRRRLDGEPVATPELIALDDIGMLFVIGTPMFEALSVDFTYALLAIGASSMIGAWGVITRVRRRALMGAIGILVGTVLLVVLPLVPVIPGMRGPAFWATVAAAGLLIIIAAASLEQGRTRIRHGIARLEALTRGWE